MSHYRPNVVLCETPKAPGASFSIARSTPLHNSKNNKSNNIYDDNNNNNCAIVRRRPIYR